MKLPIILIATLFQLSASCQTETQAVGLYNGGRLIREDSTGWLCRYTGDSSVTFFIGKDFGDYKLWKDQHLILEGNLGGRKFVDFFEKFGDWKEYYPGGALKATGQYDYDNPMGTWTYYFQNGKKKNWFTIAKLQTDSTTSYCKTGLFEEFYMNGNIKRRGYYKICFDTSFVIFEKPDSLDHEKLIEYYARGFRSKPNLTWIYYRITGEIEKKVRY